MQLAIEGLRSQFMLNRMILGFREDNIDPGTFHKKHPDWKLQVPTE